MALNVISWSQCIWEGNDGIYKKITKSKTSYAPCRHARQKSILRAYRYPRIIDSMPSSFPHDHCQPIILPLTRSHANLTQTKKEQRTTSFLLWSYVTLPNPLETYPSIIFGFSPRSILLFSLSQLDDLSEIWPSSFFRGCQCQCFHTRQSHHLSFFPSPLTLKRWQCLVVSRWPYVITHPSNY